jgi:hypothetical protein
MEHQGPQYILVDKVPLHQAINVDYGCSQGSMGAYIHLVKNHITALTQDASDVVEIVIQVIG